jgi:adenylate cyclase
LLASLGIDPVIDELVEAELIDQVSFTSRVAYAFRHPLIRTVAYESQLKADRADVHRRLAAAIESKEPDSVGENAAAIAEHLEAAGDLPGAYTWHMRAGRWSSQRDLSAAQASWRRARDIADRLSADHPDRTGKRIAPRVMLCISAWRTEATLADTGFEEVRDLCNASGNAAALALVMAGQSQALLFRGRYAESSRLVSDWLTLVDAEKQSPPDMGFYLAGSNTKFQAGEAAEGLHLAERVIEIVDGDPRKGQNLFVGGSPLALALGLRGAYGFCLGTPGWRDELDEAAELARGLDANSYASVIAYKSFAVLNEAHIPDDATILDTAEALKRAEQSGDDLALIAARFARGTTLVNCADPDTDVSDELDRLLDAIVSRRYAPGEVVRFRIHIAKQRARSGDIDGAIDISRSIVDSLAESGEMLCRGPATMILVESLLCRGADGDIAEARAAIARLEAVPTEPGFVLHELPLLRLRALVARADGDEPGYRSLADRYRARASELAFEGHMALADSMP